MRYLFVLAQSSHMSIWSLVNLPLNQQAHDNKTLCFISWFGFISWVQQLEIEMFC